MSQAIKLLKEAGYQVRICHYRAWPDMRALPKADMPSTKDYYPVHGIKPELRALGLEPNTKDGFTTARIMSPDGFWAEGEAQCNPTDTFVRALGTNGALVDALQQLEELGDVSQTVMNAMQILILEMELRERMADHRRTRALEHESEDAVRYAGVRRAAAQMAELKKFAQPVMIET